jgi:hypothetical protein
VEAWPTNISQYGGKDIVENREQYLRQEHLSIPAFVHQSLFSHIFFSVMSVITINVGLA